MTNYLIKDTTLSNIANSIRNKTGSTEEIKVADMANEIAGISAGGGGNVSVEYEIVNLTENTNSIPFTLKRLTATYGMSTSGVFCGMRNLAHQGLICNKCLY